METSQILTDFLPQISMFVGLIVSLIAKDMATSISSGLNFKYNPQFNEGDHVLIDGEDAIIVKIGFRYTVFSIQKENGDHTWRYVKNERIQFLKLEKVMRVYNKPTLEELKQQLEEVESRS